MRKLFLLTAFMLSFFSCKDDNYVPEEPQADAISVLPESKDFDNKGGSVSVMVTSTGEWTMNTKENATYDWVTTDKTSGVDGDMIKFSVEPNETEETRFAYYVFTSGAATSEFKITSFAGEIQAPLITIDETNITKDYNKGSFEVIVKYSEGVNYRDIKAIIPENVTWLKHTVTLEGDDDGVAKMQFECEALEGYESREISFIIQYDAVKVQMKVIQTPKFVIIPEYDSYNIGLDEGTLEIKVNASVEYDVEVDVDWLTDYAHNNGTHSWKYSSFEGERKAIVRFIETSPAEGKEPIITEVQVIQSKVLITTAARINDFRAAFCCDVTNKEELKLGKNMTIEILINPEDGAFFTPHSIIGIERRFLIRHSAGGFYDRGKWEVVYVKNALSGNEPEEVKVSGSMLNGDKWNHIAVTIDKESNKITLYHDGSIVNQAELDSDMKEIDFTEKFKIGYHMQEFSVGYSFDDSRDFYGLVSEIRIWNRALTNEEINAKNHFYRVDANSDGLVSYWKVNDGEGTIIKDFTFNGNDLVGQKYNGSWYEENLKWESVKIPE